MSEEIARELGAISATLDSIKREQARQGGSLEVIDGRLRSVEKRSALNGAVSGGVIAIAVAFIKDKFSV